MARRIFAWSEEEYEAAVQQVVRRPEDGGVGLLPEARRSCFAYLGSWLDAAQGLAPEVDVFAHAGLGTVLGERLRRAYGQCVAANPKKLPETLREFLRNAVPEELEGKFRRADGSVRWQALLISGRDAEEAGSWLASAPRETKRRLAEMGGAWVYAADVEGCVLTSRIWQIAMRLRFGLDVLPALPEEGQHQCSCQMANKQGGKCLKPLDAKGHHACTCQKESQQLARHSAIVRELGKALRRRGLWVVEERWVDAL
ncbi:MAG: hypothetical protein VX193_01020, partial [Candidatus Thermoplasmatota archaeon]|nr:hypothetical protein [Candidatus Thermoplasmatota archaeon]